MNEYSTCISWAEKPAPAVLSAAAAGITGLEQAAAAAFVAFELITTGYNQEIIDLGAVRYEGCVEVASYSTLVSPGKALPAEALDGTGITASALTRAPGLSEVIAVFDILSRDAVLLAHGGSCNMWLLRGAYKKTGRALNRPTADALPSVRQVYDVLRRRYPYPDELIGDFIAPPAEPYRAVDCARFLGGEFLRALAELDNTLAGRESRRLRGGPSRLGAQRLI